MEEKGQRFSKEMGLGPEECKEKYEKNFQTLIELFIYNSFK